jgi:hypothetical protein
MDKKQIKRGAVVVASAATVLGLVLASPSFAASKGHVAKASSSSSSTPSASTAPTFGKGDGDGDHGKGGRGHGHDGFGPGAEVSQSVTVNVPDDGKTYEVVVTDTTVRRAPADAPAGAPVRLARTVVVAVTGTGSQTVTVPDLHPGTYKVDLVAVSSTQTLTVAKPVSSTPNPSVTPLPTN